MNESEYMKLREQAWRRPLTPDERSRLQDYFLVHSEAQADWEEDAALTQLLTRMPNAPLSSNFTAQVVQAIQLEQRRQQRKGAPGLWRLRSWLPRLAVAGLVVGLGAFGLHGYRQHDLAQQRTKYLDMLVTSAASTFPNPKIWEDFDTIVNLGPAVSPIRDDMLWAALDPSTP